MATNTDLIQQLYVAYYNRPADVGGLQFWVGKLDAGVSLDAISKGFNSAVEYTSLYAGKTPDQIVDTVYMNLFGRHAEQGGLNFWSPKVQDGTISTADLVKFIGAGAVDATGAPNADGIALANKATAAAAFTAELLLPGHEAERLGYASNNQAGRDFVATVTDDTSLATALTNVATATAAAVPPPVTTNVTLTTGIDSGAAFIGGSGSDIFNAPVINGADTLSSLDSINGGAGNDVLNVVTVGTTLAAGVTVTNIETINLSTAGAITAANISGWTGANTLNVAAGGAIAGVVAAATTDINVANGLAGVTVNGGKNVVITNGTAGNIIVGNTAAAAGNITATNNFAGGTINIKGAGTETATSTGGSMTFTNGTSVSATAAGAVTLDARTAHLNTQAAATSANGKATGDTDASGVAKTAAATKVTNLGNLATAIAAATNVAADASTALSIQLATTTAFHAGSITATDKIAIDAAFGGSLATSTAAARTAAQAVLTPLQTAAATASASAIASDVTNDALAAAAKAAADAVVAADGTAATSVEAATVTATTNTTLASATITGNYGTTNNTAHNAVLDGSTLNNVLTTVTLDNAAGATLTGGALTKVVVNNGQNDVTITNTTVGHTQNLTLNNVVSGIIADNVATTLNLVTAGADGSEASVSASSATTVNISGTGMVFDAQTFAVAAVITATGGDVTIGVGAGQTYTGGAGVDTVTISNGAVQTKVVSGGAGTADQLVLGNATDFSTAAAAAKFTNFEVLELQSGISVADITAFTGSTFTSAKLDGGATTLGGLNATQAGHIQIAGSGTYTLNVTGASTVGQLDTVGLTISDGLGAVNTITLTTPVLAGVETLNLVNTDNVVISSLTSSTALTAMHLSGAGTVNITTGALALNVNTVIDAHLETGAVTINAVASTANGISLIGSATKANTLTGNTTHQNSLTGGSAADTLVGGSQADIIAGGEGNNTIHGGGGADTITVGNGDNLIDGFAGGTVTAGNGWNVIVGGAGVDTITVGTGGNLITGGAGGDIISFGTHVAGVIDGLKLVATGDALSAATTAALATAVATSAAGADIVTGLHTGDTIDVATVINTVTGALGTTIAAASGTTASLVVGNYDTTSHAFTVSATGTDSMFVYDVDGAGAGTVVEAVVLVGFHGTATAAAGVITLG